MRATILFFSLSLFFSITVNGQDNNEHIGNQVIIILLDKAEITGKLVSENEQEIVVNSTSLGLVTFQLSEVKKVIYLDPRGRIPNPNPTRYFIGQSAYTLEKGEGYYQNIYGFVNLVSYGITDRFSILAGTELISLFSGSPILYTNLKYGVPISDKLQGAISFSYLTSAGDLAGELNLGSLNALLTYGNKEHNVTVGTGYALANGEINDTGILTIGGMSRLTNKLAFITENYVLLSDGRALFSGGLRYIAKKMTLDLLVIQGGFPAIDIVLKL